MVDIVHRVGIKGSIAAVYQALTTVDGIAGWWTRETTGDIKTGGRMQVRFCDRDGRELGSMDIRVTSLELERQVGWRFESGPAEWIGTEVTFSLKQEDEFTIVLFNHRQWREPVEFMAHCSMKWATFLMSLKQYVEDGRGSPSPDDIKIDNWN